MKKKTITNALASYQITIHGKQAIKGGCPDCDDLGYPEPPPLPPPPPPNLAAMNTG